MSLDDIYVNVTICSEGRVTKRTITRVDPDENVGNLLSHAGWNYNADFKVTSIKAGVAIDRETTDVEVTTPVAILRQFSLTSVKLNLVPTNSSETPCTSVKRPSAFDKMMEARRICFLPEPKADLTKANHRLYNDLLHLLKKENIGWPMESVNTTGKKIVGTIHSVLWYIEAQHDKFEKRGFHIPPMYESFHNYVDHKASHKKPPLIEAQKLTELVQATAEILMFPWFGRSSNAQFYKATSSLVETLNRYLDFLKDQQTRNVKRQKTEAPLRGPDDSFTLVTIEGKREFNCEYEKLREQLEQHEVYQPVDLLNCVPENRYTRRHWLDDMAFPFPIAKFTHHHGNYLGNLEFVWRLPVLPEDRSDEKTLSAVKHAKSFVKTYSTRAMKKEFFEKYQKVDRLTPAIMRRMYSDLTGDSSASETELLASVDQQVAEFLLSTEEEEIIYDLRKLNGKNGSTKFDAFWEETRKYIEEMVPAVHERRHGEQLYLPFILSIEELRNKIRERLPPSTDIPSNEWLRLQFWPKNVTSLRALQHTGRFDLKFAIQQRLLRATHVDSKIGAVQYKYLRNFAIKFRNNSTLLYLDDKAIVPVGDPGRPVATGVRAHNKSLAPVNGPALVALDHDFHIHGVVPSVCFISSIPEDISDSFFQGQVFVTCKNKVFEASDATRHGTEILQILRETQSEDGSCLDSPILLCYTDGGPDHRTTYPSVQLASVALFILLDLDMFVTCRTAPCQSYANLAERVNSLLNLALQNVALSRDKMDDTLEARVKHMSSMKELRSASAKSQALKQAMIKSVEPTIKTLNERFGCLKLKEEPVNAHQAATSEDVVDFVRTLKLIDENFDVTSLSKKSIESSSKMMDFIQKHCRKRHYIFQIKKCESSEASNCWYCSMCPPRLSEEVLQDLNFIPDPVLTGDKSEFQQFQDVYGTDTDDNARPSVQLSGISERDKLHKTVLVAAKVRSKVVCGECRKPRCIFSNKKLDVKESKAIRLIQGESNYVCGDSLFPEGSTYYDSVVVKEGLRCGDPMEVSYYSAKLVKLPDCCFYCASEGPLASDNDIQQLQSHYTVVRSICCQCKAAGKEPAVRGTKNVKK